MIFFVAKNYLFLVIKITVHIAHCSNNQKYTIFCNLYIHTLFILSDLFSNASIM